MLKVELHQKCPSNVPAPVRVLFSALASKEKNKKVLLFPVSKKTKVTSVGVKTVTIDFTPLGDV